MELKGIVESLIFASNKPLTLQQLRNLTNTPLRQLKAVVEELQAQHQDSGIQIAEVGGGYQFRTHPESVNWVRRLLAGRPQRLTRPMLETLAIIAYQQPITRPEIEEIRGVDCGNTLRVLLERSLLRILGKKEEVGRPLLYGTTKFFLEFFQLPSLKDLPSLKQFTELSPEHQDQVQFFFGNKGDQDPAAASGEVLEGPPEPPHLRAIPEQAPQPQQDQDAASAAMDAPVNPEADTSQLEAGNVVTTMAPEADAPGAAEDDAGADAPESPAGEVQDETKPSTQAPHAKSAASPSPSLENDEEDDAVLDSLDRAIARAGSVLREINPRPKRKGPEAKAAATESDSPLAASEGAVSPEDAPAAKDPEESTEEDAPSEGASSSAAVQP